MPFVEVDDDYADEPRLPSVIGSTPYAGDEEVIDGFLALTDAHVTSELSLDECEELELTNCSLDGVSLSGVANVRIQRCTLTSCDLSQATMNRLHQVRFHGCKLIGASLAGATVKDVAFTTSVLRYANLRMATFERVSFDDCQLREVDFYDSQLRHVAFDRSELHEVSLDRTRFDHVDVRGATTIDIAALNQLSGLLISDDQIMALAYHFALATGVSIEATPDHLSSGSS